MKTLLLIITIAFLTESATAQKKLWKNDIVIQIRNTQILVDIQKNSNSAKLVYSLVDSVQQSAMEHDPQFKINMAKLEKSVSSKSNKFKLLDEVISFVDSYTIYHRDSLILNLIENPGYKQLLISIAQAPKSELQPPKTRVMIDGTLFTYKITTAKGEQRVIAQSPTAESHPLLYDLLMRSLKIYRELKPNGILKAKIWGVY
jgi:hypothetical protein